MRIRQVLTATTAAALAVGAVIVGAGGAQGATVTYTASQTIPVPPAANYAGSAGGDGWSVAFSRTSVYNIFHHQSSLTIACHRQSDASACWDPKTITDDDGGGFYSSGHSGLWFDSDDSNIYTYASRPGDGSAGVVCIDTVLAETDVSPFCGYTKLTGDGEASVETGISGLSEPVAVNGKWYAFNYVSGQEFDGSRNRLLCFDQQTHAACPGQPFAVPIGDGSTSVNTFPEPQIAAIGGRVLVASIVGGTEQLGCWNPAAGAGCTGAWPLTSPSGYTANAASPFPRLDAAGVVTGFCLPTSGVPCYDLSAAPVATPPGLPGVVDGTIGWNGSAVAIGPRVYLPSAPGNRVMCYSWATDSSCANFPKTFSGLDYLYTVSPDPARPTCLWVNADNGGSQIQSFDAYTGGACGDGPIRVLASSFVVPSVQCRPATYTSLQISQPPRNAYDTGSITFQDADAGAIPGAGPVSIDNTGTATLSGSNLSTSHGLPQFLITLTNPHQAVGAVDVTLTWTGVDDPSCVKPGTIVTPPAGGGGGPCGDAVFLAVPGNGETTKGPNNLFVSRELKKVYDTMKSAAAPKKTSFRVVDDPVGSSKKLTAGLDKLRAHSQPAYSTAAHAKLASNVGKYIAHKNDGVAALAASFGQVRAECPGAKIVLGGYSQGAMVVHEFLDTLAAGPDPASQNAVAAVALIGDPERVAASAVHEASSAPAASSGACAVVSDLVRCPEPAAVTDIATMFRARTTSICAAGDLACATSTVFEDLVAHWSSPSAQRSILNRAYKIHGAYASLPATGATGQAIGHAL
jgi:cutinase